MSKIFERYWDLGNWLYSANLTRHPTTTSITAVDTRAKLIAFDKADFDSDTTEVYFEVVGKTNNTSGQASFELYDETNTTIRATITVGTGTTSITRTRSSDLWSSLASGENEYTVRYYSNNASYTTSIYSAHLIIKQTDSGTFTKTAGNMLMGDYNSILNTSYSTNLAEFNWGPVFVYDSSKWAETNFYLEATMGDVATGTAYCDLYCYDTNSQVSGSEITVSSSANPDRVRSGALTLTNGYSYWARTKYVSESGILWQCSLIAKTSAATNVTKFEDRRSLWGEDDTSVGAGGPYATYYQYNPANYDGSTYKFFVSVTGGHTQESGTSNLNLYDDTANAVLGTSVFSWTGGYSQEEDRTITMPTSTSDIDCTTSNGYCSLNMLGSWWGYEVTLGQFNWNNSTKANIRVNDNTKANSAKADILTVDVTKANSAIANIPLPKNLKTDLWSATFSTTYTDNNSSLANFIVSYTKDNSAIASIVVANTDAFYAKANIRVNDNTQNNSAKASIVVTNTNNNSSKADFKNTYTDDNSVKASIVTSNTNNNSVKANVRVNDNLQANSAKASLVHTETNNNSAIADFLTIYSKDSSAKASVVVSGSDANYVKADIRVNDNTKDNSVKASIVVTNTNNNSSKADIKTTYTQNNNVKASIVVTVSDNTNSTKADIRVNDNLNSNNTKASLLRTETYDSSVKAQIFITPTYDQSVEANILATQTKNNSVAVNIVVVGQQPNSVKADIIKTKSQDNSVRAEISVGTFPFTDNFDDSVLDADLWHKGDHATDTSTEEDGVLKTQNSTTTTSGYVRSRHQYVPKLTTLEIKVAQHSTDAGLKLCPTDPNGHQWDVYSEANWYNHQLITGPVLSPNKKVGGVGPTQIGGDSATLTVPYWARIRIDEGTIYFDYRDNSTDRWTNISSESWSLATAITEYYFVYLTGYNVQTTGVPNYDDFSWTSGVEFEKDNSVKANFIRTESSDSSVKANLIATTSQDNSVKAEISVAIIYSKDSSVLASIVHTESEDQSAIANFLTVYSKDSNSLGNILSSGQEPNSVKGNILRIDELQPSSTKANILTIYAQNNSAKASIVVTNTYDLSVKADILRAGETQAQNAKASLVHTESRDSSAKASIVVTNTFDNSPIANFIATYTKNNSVLGSILAAGQQAQSVIANIFVADNLADNSVKASIVRTESYDNSAKALIFITPTYDNSAKADILTVYGKDNSAIGNILAVGQCASSTKADILRSDETYDSNVKASILRTESYNSSAKASLLRTESYDQNVIANFLTVYSKDNEVLASIQAAGILAFYSKGNILRSNEAQDSSAKASIVRTELYNLSAKASLVETLVKNNNVVANLANTYSYDSSAKGNIAHTYTYDQSVKADIFVVTTNDNSVKAALDFPISLILPEDGYVQGSAVVQFVWKIPYRSDSKPVIFRIEIANDAGFTDIEVTKWSSHDTGFEYYNGADWVTIPKAGVDMAYSENQARISLSTDNGTHYWRVRGGAY